MKTDIVFENLKVGQKLYSLTHGDLEIYELRDQSESYPIACRGIDADGDECEYSFAKDGKYTVCNNLPNLFLTNPFEKMNQERVIEVYSKIWHKRVLAKVVDGVAYCWCDADTIERAKDSYLLAPYSTWRELHPEQPETKQPKEITLDGVEYILTPKTK